jgi:hypothetical protein
MSSRRPVSVGREPSRFTRAHFTDAPNRCLRFVYLDMRLPSPSTASVLFPVLLKLICHINRVNLRQ